MGYFRQSAARRSIPRPTPHGVDARRAAGVVCGAPLGRAARHEVTQGVAMGASKRRQMSSFDDDWPDRIWSAANEVNGGKGAAWRLPLAALAVTGCRPAALERGIEFALVTERGQRFIEATIKGVKLTVNRGQPEHRIRWATSDDTHRPNELAAIAEKMMKLPKRKILVQYDAEAISTRLRELSRQLWPRRRHHVTGYCYRELLASTAKAAGVDPAELAAAMGHRSAESQGAYARAHRGSKTRSKRPFASARGSVCVRTDRAPMARFKAASVLKKIKLRVSL